MKMKSLVTVTALAAALSACGGGDININANSIDNSVSNPGGNGSSVCAEYTSAGVTQSGLFDGTNCIYSESFVNFDTPLTESITLLNIGDGAHIFQGSLFVGENYSDLASAAAEGINRGGDGPALTIQAGVTVAFQRTNSFVAIMRGSQIFANGTVDAPITFTSEADLNGNLDPEDIQSWGGVVINGFGFTNSCQYDEGWDRFGENADPADDTPVITTGTDCSIQQEGTEGGTANHYGGAVPDDNSGVLNYVVVKHAGFDVLTGNELNGINFGAVGSGTTLENIEVYSNSDDGVEFFGGSADLTNYVALYIRDDAIDIDQGYYGTITNALVIQGGAEGESTKTGAHCVESDGSSERRVEQNNILGYSTQATINNLTCIISAKGPGVAGNSDPGAGINIEEGHHLRLNRSIVTTAYAADALLDGANTDIPANQLDFTNYCFQLEDDIDLRNAGNDKIQIASTVFACSDISANRDRNSDFTITAGEEYAAISGEAFLQQRTNMGTNPAKNVVATQVAADGSTPPNTGNLNILDGFYSVPVADMMVDGAAVNFPALSSQPSHIGAVSASNDWTAGWTYGLHPDNRGQDLWFE